MFIAKFIRFIFFKKGYVLDKTLSPLDLFFFAFALFFDLVRGAALKLRGVKLTGLLFVGAGCKFSFASRIKFGKNVRVGDNCVISGLGELGLDVGDSVSIGACSRVVVSTALSNLGLYIKIGNGVGVGEFASLGGSGGLTIGDNTIIAQYFSAHPENHNFDDKNTLIKSQGTTRKAISIGSDCWIGAKVTILSGVSIGDGCVIGAGSVVSKNIPENSIAVGVPAKVVAIR